MLVLGLTGNIGCGKSSISKKMSEFGYDIIDADLITREIYNYSDVMNKMKNEFPEAISDGKIDRKILGGIVFEDKNKMKLLNEITHNKIEEIINDRINKAFLEKKEVAMIDAALLYETGLDKKVDKVIVVYCDEETQLNRIVKRDGISVDEATKRMNSQMNQYEKIKRCDYSLNNSGTFDELNIGTKKLSEIIEIWLREEQATPDKCGGN